MQDKAALTTNPNTPGGAAEQAWGGSQLLAAIIRPGPAKDVCENLELCKGRVPSISLQVLCGSGCVKNRKFGEKHRKA